MENVNIIVGRFQPFTNGHLKCITDVYNKYGIRSIILIIDSNINKKHPFNKSILVEMLNNIKYNYNNYCADYIFVKNADIVINSNIIREFGYEPYSWVCGSDRYLPYLNMVDKYAIKANLSPKFKLLCVNRVDSDISATRVREALKSGNYEEVNISIPKCLHYMLQKFKDNIVV